MSELSNYEATVNSFYLAFLGRPADPEGQKFWAQHLVDNGGDYRVITEAFAASKEAQVRFGDGTAQERIAEIYQQLFNRAPDQAGLSYWADVVEQGHASLADVAIVILNGAQGADASLASLREQAAADFTALVETSGSEYTGYAAVEAARVLVRAVTQGASQDDVAKLVQATVAFAEIASTNPAVIDAIATGSSLLALFDTPRGLLDPVTLAQALADVAKAAAGSPATLESLLRGGGMAQVLKVMPASATLQDVVVALAQGGLPAAIEVVYPSAPVTPAPSAPVSMLKFDSVESGVGDRDLKDKVTKLESADVKFTYDGAVKSGQSFQYTIDGGKHWISTGIDTSTRGVVVLTDVDLTVGAQDLSPPPRMGVMEAGPVEDVLTKLQLRLVDANKVEILSATETLVLDRFAEVPEVALVNAAANYFGGFSYGNTNVAAFAIDGLEQGAVVQYLYMAPGANMATWVNKMPELNDGMHTVQVRQLDAAGNASEAKEMRFNLNREAPDALTIRLANDTGSDAHDGVTSDGTVIIEGLGAPWVTGWEYSVDDGKNWKFGGVSKDGVVPQLELGTLDIATGALLVRQINYAGNVSVASNKLEFTYDDTAPTEVLSFKRIEGELDGVLKTDQAKVDLTFDIGGRNDGIVQWRVKGEDKWTDAQFDSEGRTATLKDIDLSTSDPTMEVRVVDAAGNVGYKTEFAIDGPYSAGSVTVKMTPAGLRVESTVAGVIEIGNVEVTSDHVSGGAIVGRVVVGALAGAVSGTLTVTPPGGQPIADSSGRSYIFGDEGYDQLAGSNLWGFDGYDELWGTQGDDYLSGGADNDIIYSEGGNDTIVGGKQADTIYLSKGAGIATLVLEPGDTRTGTFVSGDYLNGADRIHNAELGDVIKVGSVFDDLPVVGNTLLDAGNPNQVAVVRGFTDGSRFTISDTGTSYLVQWTDTNGINSVFFNEFGADGFGLEIDSDMGTMTLVEPPAVISVFAGINYRFSKDGSGFRLRGDPDDVIQANTDSGLLDADGVTLSDFSSGVPTALAVDYTDGAGFGVDAGGYLNFDAPLATGVYMASWSSDAFATASGRFDSGAIAFAGGVNGNVFQQVFNIQSNGLQQTVKLGNGLIDKGSEGRSLMYEVNAGATAIVRTGTGRDVVDADGGALTIQYAKGNNNAQDVIFNFGADDRIEFHFDGNVEPETLTIEALGPLSTAELSYNNTTTMSNLKLELDNVVVGAAGALVLVRDGGNDAAMLLYYNDKDGNALADASEITLLATFSEGVPGFQQIDLIGMVSP